jgi:16S rRNA (guanine527-N7)-methyltransferase
MDSREKFDVCTSRAVARLNVLSELCLPFVKIGGKFIAMKAGRGADEHAEAIKEIEFLGGKLAESKALKLVLDTDEIEREIYVYSKIKRTPSQYPRKYAQILKKPL